MEHSAVTVLVLLELNVFLHSTSKAVSVTPAQPDSCAGHMGGPEA